MDDQLSKESNISIKVNLNKEKHPRKILWHSDDNPEGNHWMEAKAMLISFFDKEYLDTYKIDLWTHEMQVAEMDRFIFQTLRAMADTYRNATGNTALANDIQRFVQYFGEKTQIITEES